MDHSTEAWAAHDAGKTITADMVDVVCRACNGERGPARGPNATDEHRPNQAADLARIEADLTLDAGSGRVQPNVSPDEWDF